jgi:hypothetical protein
MADAQRIEETKSVIRRFHPVPVFIETTYADIPLEQFFNLEGSAPGGGAAAEVKAALSEAELDRYLDDLLDSPDLEITPPDILVSVAYRWGGDNLDEVRAVAGAVPSSVVRGKGFVEERGTMHIFNFVMGDWTIEKTDVPREDIQHKNVVVFIGPPESMDGIDAATQNGTWDSMGIYQPYSEEA